MTPDAMHRHELNWRSTVHLKWFLGW